MATTLQKVLPHSVLPRAPSPNSSSPNAGIRSSITEFIAASPDPSLDVERQAGARTLVDHSRPNGASGSHTEPSLKPSATAEPANRRGIARSTRIFGVDHDAQDGLALSQLKNGKIDVSFEASLNTANSHTSNKGKTVQREQEVPLFDVDLEAGDTEFLSPTSSRKGRLFSIGSRSKGPTAPSSSISKQPKLEEEAIKNNPDDEDDEDDQDDAHLLGTSASTHSGYFAPGDTSFGYNSISASQGIAVGFEGITIHESGWMVVSSIFVLALVLVAVLISVDIIDWPGDGIGRQ